MAVGQTMTTTLRPTNSTGRPIPLNIWPCSQLGSNPQSRHKVCLKKGTQHLGLISTQLLSRIIETYSSPGDLVCLCSGGSNSTLADVATEDRQITAIESMSDHSSDFAKAGLII